MRAIVCAKYGPPEVLQLKEVPMPIPKFDELLIKNHAVTVVMGDCELRSFEFIYPFHLKILIRLMMGIRGPRKKILGQQLAGVVEDVGNEVTRFRKGDQVFAATGTSMGAYAEYTCIPESGLVETKPDNMTFEEASTIPIGGLEALNFLRKANIESGQRVLINGAGGSIGIIAIQLAKYWGTEVTAVDSARKLDMMSSLGADHVMDYRTENILEKGEMFDVIFDVVGVTTFSDCLKSLSDNGTYLLGNGMLSRSDKKTAERNNKRVIDWKLDYQTEHLIYLKELIEAGTIRTFIERNYPLEEMVEAHKYVETGQKIGNVVITVD